MINLIKLTLRINRLEFLVILQTLLAKFFCFHTLIDKGASTTYLDAALCFRHWFADGHSLCRYREICGGSSSNRASTPHIGRLSSAALRHSPSHTPALHTTQHNNSHTLSIVNIIQGAGPQENRVFKETLDLR